MKTCCRCGLEKPLTDYHKDASKSDGLVSACRACKKSYRAEYHAKNREKLCAQVSAWQKANPDAVKACRARRYPLTRQVHLERRRVRHAERYRSDTAYALQVKARAMLTRVLKAVGRPKDFVTFEKIGYTHEKLKERLEVNFTKGMTWRNFGEWEIDHTIPVSYFASKGEKRPEVINALCNLRPMWSYDNRSKGSKYAPKT